LISVWQMGSDSLLHPAGVSRPIPPADPGHLLPPAVGQIFPFSWDAAETCCKRPCPFLMEIPPARTSLFFLGPLESKLFPPPSFRDRNGGDAPRGRSPFFPEARSFVREERLFRSFHPDTPSAGGCAVPWIEKTPRGSFSSAWSSESCSVSRISRLGGKGPAFSVQAARPCPPNGGIFRPPTTFLSGPFPIGRCAFSFDGGHGTSTLLISERTFMSESD